MQIETRLRLNNLCTRVTNETDVQRFAALILEFNVLLEEELKRLKEDSETKTR
jgi:hypothetical protein